MSDAAFGADAAAADDAALRETIRRRVEAAGTSFYWAMRLLPEARRNGMYAVYAWCREVDDIADGDRPVAFKLDALAACRDEITALYEGRPRQLVARALQLTNILRDLDEDVQRGRLYLPREILDSHGIRSAEPAVVIRHPALPAVCRELAGLAERHFRDAEAAMVECRRRAMRPAALMSAVYRATLRELLRGGWRDPAARVALSRATKLWLVLRHGLV